MTVTRTTSSTPIVNVAPPREPRCRMHNRLGEPCPNPALDWDPKTIKICIRHLVEAIDLYRERYNEIAAQEGY